MLYLISFVVALALFAIAARLGGATPDFRLSLRDRWHALISIGRLAGTLGKIELEAEKLKRVSSARDIASKAETENRDLTSEERGSITTLIGEAKGFHDQILALDGDLKALDALNVLGQPSGTVASGATAEKGKGQTLGEKFTNSDAIKSWLGTVSGGSGRIPDTAKGLHSPAVSFGAKDLITGGSQTSGGALFVPDWLGLLDGLGAFMRPLVLADLVTHGTTGTDQVEYARVTGFTNNASTVAEATTEAALGGGVTDVEGGLKPKSNFTLEKKTANVKTVAHWLPATKRALSDAGQIRTLIDQFVQYGLKEELEDQIATGDDSGENFEGILHVSGVQGQAFDTDLLTTTRKARTLVRLVGRTIPTAYVFHPLDNEKIDLLKTNTGLFYFGGPTSNPSAPLWGLPRVESEAMPEGTGMVANWNMAVLWDREEAGIQVSDSHADFFTRNLVAILAEMRAAFGVIRPKAFVTIDLTAGS